VKNKVHVFKYYLFSPGLLLKYCSINQSIHPSLPPSLPPSINQVNFMGPAGHPDPLGYFFSLNIWRGRGRFDVDEILFERQNSTCRCWFSSVGRERGMDGWIDWLSSISVIVQERTSNIWKHALYFSLFYCFYYCQYIHLCNSWCHNFMWFNNNIYNASMIHIKIIRSIWVHPRFLVGFLLFDL
jgi:hypothetical protein